VASGRATRDELVGALREGLELGARMDWRSHDPYDLLLSPLARAVQAHWWFGARLVVQAGKHSGSGLRRIVGVPQHEEPKALADHLRAACGLIHQREESAEAHAAELSERLRKSAVCTETGLGWGLDFPYASRFVNVGARTPNLYVTICAVQALVELLDLRREPATVDAVAKGTRFIVDDLGTFEHDGLRWLRYWTGLEAPTVNVQALAASLLAQAGATLEDERMLSAADEAAETVIRTQRPDGSWPYSTDGRASFVDGFHTGFTLQGLSEYAARRGTNADAATAAVERGYAYFLSHLLTPDGLPRGFSDGKVSLDGQNIAQCVQTLVVCGAPADLEHAFKLWRLGVAGPLRGAASAEGRFVALRWRSGPAALATAYLLGAMQPSSSVS
jgi:hypothetical protein